jgi:hypothetical protein
MANLRSDGVRREKYTETHAFYSQIFGRAGDPPRTYCTITFSPWHATDIPEEEFPEYREWVEDVVCYVQDMLANLAEIEVEIQLRVGRRWNIG